MADQPPKTGPTVQVACSLPHGLILEIDAPQKMTAAAGAGESTVWRGTGETVTIAGALAGHPDTINPGRQVLGYGLTEISADFWDRWIAQKKDYPPVVKGFLFATPTREGSLKEADNRKAIKTGLAPLDADKPAPGLTKATTD